MPVNQAAQFLWIGGALSRMEQLCLCSFLNHGYDVHLYTYGPVTGIPPGVKVLAGVDILPADRIFTYQEGWGKGSYAGFADLFRYHLLFQRGGWWFDMDFISIKHLPAPAGFRVASSFEGTHGTQANCCAMYAPEPGHAAMRWLRDAAEHELSANQPIGFGQIGPFLLQRYIREHDLHSSVAPWFEFSPYPQSQIRRVALPDFASVVKDKLRLLRYLYWQLTRSDFRAGFIRNGTRAIHLHNELWRSSGLDKNRRYHSLSLYERLAKKHHQTL